MTGPDGPWTEWRSYIATYFKITTNLVQRWCTTLHTHLSQERWQRTVQHASLGASYRPTVPCSLTKKGIRTYDWWGSGTTNDGCSANRGTTDGRVDRTTKLYVATSGTCVLEYGMLASTNDRLPRSPSNRAWVVPPPSRRRPMRESEYIFFCSQRRPPNAASNESKEKHSLIRIVVARPLIFSRESYIFESTHYYTVVFTHQLLIVVLCQYML